LRQSGGPLYQQLRQDLLARIRRGEFASGSLLPSENQLCKQYGVSVTTARRAFLELVKEGVVQRMTGVGTMVSSRVRRVRLSFLSIDYEGDAWRRTPSAMGEIVAGVGAASWQRDASFSMTGVGGDEAVGYLRRLVEERSVDGVLLRTADDISEEYLEVLEGAGMPYVVVKRHIPGRRMNCVVSDDVAGAKIATEHLLDLGHERIGFVCAKPHITIGQQRLAGYRAALEARDLPFDELFVRQEPRFTIAKGREAVESLLGLPKPPSAIFVASDTMALGAYEAARELGLEIPRDVALVGYDDLAPVAVLQPPLTTVRTSYYEFGRLATQLLLNLVEGREVAPRQRVIEPTLMVRGSTAGPRADARTAPKPVERIAAGRREGIGRLAGKVILFRGGGPMGEETRRRCADAGARVVFEDDAAPGIRGVDGRIDTVVYQLSARGDLGVGLERTISRGRDAAHEMASRGGGHVLYTASVPLGTAVGTELEAARAALRNICGELKEELGSRGVRTNAVVYATDVDPAATIMFLTSDEAADLSGEALALRGTGRL
jgi:DNA-binding LacI/PurR family transcriptional regulator